ncbi:MAG: hypothetical protein ACYSYM_04855 [Planctomycetota bacterium]
MSKARKTRGAALTTDAYRKLSHVIDALIEMFERAAEETREMRWWSMTVAEDIIASGGLDVTMHRWAELLQADFVAELCNLGGVGNRDRSRWTLYAVAGKGVSLDDYRKIADVCASTMKALGIPGSPRFKVTVHEKLDVSDYYDGLIQRAFPSRHKKFVDWRESAFRSLWITEQPVANLTVSKYLDVLAESGDDFSTASSGLSVESYWILSWFEFMFDTARELPGCAIRVHSGSQFTTYLECAEIPFRRIDNDICEASILALKLLRREARARIQEVEMMLSNLKTPVACGDVAGIIHKRSDNVARTLKGKRYPVVKAGGKYYCEAEDAAVIWPKWKNHWQKRQKKEDF